MEIAFGLLAILASFGWMAGLYYRTQALLNLRMLAKSQAVPRPLTGLDQELFIVIPCRGVEPGLENAVDKLLGIMRGSPFIRVLFIVEKKTDGAVRLIESSIKKLAQDRVDILISEEFSRLLSSLKCEALSNAFNFICQSSGPSGPSGTNDPIVVFMDSDGNISQKWLEQCVGEVKQSEGDVITSYRYFRGDGHKSFAAVLVALFSDDLLVGQCFDKTRFIWGGAMAARLSTFRKLEFADTLATAISDDCAITVRARALGVGIRFAPSLLVPSNQAETLKPALAFICRQLQMVYYYMKPAYWSYGAVKTVLALFGLVGAMMAILGHGYLWLTCYILMAMLLAYLQYRLIVAIVPGRISPVFEMLKIVLAPIIMLYVVVAIWLAFLRREQVLWRGVFYRVDSLSGRVIVRK